MCDNFSNSGRFRLVYSHFQRKFNVANIFWKSIHYSGCHYHMISVVSLRDLSLGVGNFQTAPLHDPWLMPGMKYKLKISLFLSWYMCLSDLMVKTSVGKTGDLRFKSQFRHKFFSQ